MFWSTAPALISEQGILEKFPAVENIQPIFKPLVRSSTAVWQKQQRWCDGVYRCGRLQSFTLWEQVWVNRPWLSQQKLPLWKHLHLKTSVLVHPEVSPGGKIRKSPKSSVLILWGPWISIHIKSNQPTIKLKPTDQLLQGCCWHLHKFMQIPPLASVRVNVNREMSDIFEVI